MVTTCFLTFIAIATLFLEFEFFIRNIILFDCLLFVEYQLRMYSQQLQVHYVATILYTIVCMDCANLAWLDPLPCRTLLQSIWPYTKEGVAMLAWNYVLQCLPMFKTAVVICSFNQLIALEAKCHPSNGSNFIVCFMTCMLNIQMFRITRPVDPIYDIAGKIDDH